MILKRFVFFILFAFIIVSKEILVFNEEILVLFSFTVFCFLFFNYFTPVFLSELSLRSLKIKEEFSLYEETRLKTIIHTISYHNKLRSLSEKVKFISLTTNENINFILTFSLSLHTKLLNVDIDDKLRRLLSFESTTIIILQNEINLCLFHFVLSIFNSIDQHSNFKFLLKSIITLPRVDLC